MRGRRCCDATFLSVFRCVELWVAKLTHNLDKPSWIKDVDDMFGSNFLSVFAVLTAGCVLRHHL